MKKLIAFFIFLTVSITFSAAFAEEVVPQNGSVQNYSYNPVTGEEMLKSVKDASAKVDALKTTTSRRLNGLEDGQRMTNGAVATLANNVGGLTTELGKSNTKIDAVGANVQDAKVFTGKAIESVKEQEVSNTRITVGVSILLAVLLFLAVWLFSRRSRQHVEEQARPLNDFINRADQIPASIATAVQPVVDGNEEILTEVRNGFAAMQTGFAKLPAEVAAAILTLDASPFEFEVAGHQVTYQSPIEGITEGYYLLLHVPENMAGDPATYDRSHEANRGVARRNCRKTMQKYFEGGFDAPEFALQKSLIKYLINKTKEVSFRKIS